MADVTTFTFEVEEDLKKAFSEATEAQQSNDADVLRDFMRGYVEQQRNDTEGYDAWFRRKVQAAINAANAGEVISGDDIEAEFSILRENARRSSSR
jgi:predicted transcriptional regulator